jgi:hypothetical protein
MLHYTLDFSDDYFIDEQANVDRARQALRRRAPDARGTPRMCDIQIPFSWKSRE